MNFDMFKVCDWIRITFILSICVFLCLNFAQALSVNSRKSTSASRYLLQLSPKESDARIKLLRAHQKIESCKISFDFIHRAEESIQPTITQGVLLITSVNQRILKRLFLIDERGEILVDYIFHEGQVSNAWKRLGSQSKFILLDEDEMFSPLIEGILFRAVDVIMPYINWENYSYEGVKASGIGSIVHNYLFSTKNEIAFSSQGVSAVRLSIDSKYNTVRKIEYLDNAEVLNELHIAGVKKFENLWIISRLIFSEKNDKTIFRVKEADILAEDNQANFFDPSFEKIVRKSFFFDQ